MNCYQLLFEENDHDDDNNNAVHCIGQNNNELFRSELQIQQLNIVRDVYGEGERDCVCVSRVDNVSSPDRTGRVIQY